MNRIVKEINRINGQLSKSQSKLELQHKIDSFKLNQFKNQIYPILERVILMH